MLVLRVSLPLTLACTLTLDPFHSRWRTLKCLTLSCRRQNRRLTTMRKLFYQPIVKDENTHDEIRVPLPFPLLTLHWKTRCQQTNSHLDPCSSTLTSHCYNCSQHSTTTSQQPFGTCSSPSRLSSARPFHRQQHTTPTCGKDRTCQCKCCYPWCFFSRHPNEQNEIRAEPGPFVHKNPSLCTLSKIG